MDLMNYRNRLAQTKMLLKGGVSVKKERNQVGELNKQYEDQKTMLTNKITGITSKMNQDLQECDTENMTAEEVQRFVKQTRMPPMRRSCFPRPAGQFVQEACGCRQW